ncbi:MAG: PP2C family protein-serine/threonine phosphatase [Holophagae bacterium]|jgi:sigma-B regulation protein RsbU (phosphoserine phosphatase)
MSVTDLDRTVDDLLDRLGASFRLDRRIGDRPLGELFESTIRHAAGVASVDFSRLGDPAELHRSADGIMHFFYRPHLFPDMDDALRLGHLVQFDLLPRELPDRSPVEAAAMLESYCHLSGDLFGWQSVADTTLTAWMLDVSGHGVRAGFGAVVMKLILADIDPTLPLSDLAKQVERRFLELRHPDDRATLYATGVFLRLGDDGRTEYLSAGHPPLLVRRSDGRVEEHEATSVPLVLLPDIDAGSRSITLGPTDTLLVFTDGLIELAGPEGQPFGLERTSDVLGATPGDPIDVIEALAGAVADYHDLDRLDDDLSLLAMRRRT